MKRYNHFNTTTYIQDKNEVTKHYLPISIAPHITISHYHKMKEQRQIISSCLNDHNLLNAERYTTDETIPPYKTTSIQQDIILQDKRKHLYQRQRRIYLCRLICFLMLCNEEDKQSIKENHRQRYRTILSVIYFNSTHFNDNHHTGEIIPFNMDEWYNTILKRPISHYKGASRTTYHKQDKTRTRQIKRYILQLYTFQ